MIDINSTIRTPYPKHPYEAIAKDILGSRYELSLTFVGTKRAAHLNHEYRKKNYTPNVLSFPLTDHCGQIVICPHVAKKEASKFNMTIPGYIGFLFIHGCLHLKGHDHGATMEKAEQKYCKKYSLR